MPPEIELLRSNNNLDAAFHRGRLFLAFRSAPSHFASPDARIYVISSDDGGADWRHEATFKKGRDLREPRLLSWKGNLFLYFFQAGASPFSFKPERIYASKRTGEGKWEEPRPISEKDAVVWRTKVIDGVPYMIRYSGGGQMYGASASLPRLRVELLTTEDGFSWRPVDEENPVVYEGGGSEADFAFDRSGNLWAVIRNEVGDSGGWGSKICKASKDSPARWECTDDRRKFDSPLVFEHAGEIFLIARRNLAPWRCGDYDLGLRFLPPRLQWLVNELSYWLTPKRTSLYRIDTSGPRIDHVLDFPSRGDTAFPAIVKTDADSYLVFNYSSDIDGCDMPWVAGQLSPTAIYVTELELSPANLTESDN